VGREGGDNGLGEEEGQLVMVRAALGLGNCVLYTH
jgi:hypothetical protein